MDKYKVTIEFYTTDLVNIPEKCPGSTFSFHGILQNLGDFSINGNQFIINIDKQTTVEKHEIETNQDCLIYDISDVDSLEMNSENAMQVKNMKFIPGVMCMSFKNGPVEYTISTLTQYFRNSCDGNWLQNLEKIIKDLNITDLYMVGKGQKIIIQNYVKNVPIHVWMKPRYLSYCPKCLHYGCSQFKTKVIIHDIYIRNLCISCE